MRDFWKLLKRFVGPYKSYLGGSIILNLLSAIFNLFSFAFIIPILDILFKTDHTTYEFILWDSGADLKEMLFNNMYYAVTQLIDKFGGSTTLLIIGLFFGFTTFDRNKQPFQDADMLPKTLFAS